MKSRVKASSPAEADGLIRANLVFTAFGETIYQEVPYSKQDGDVVVFGDIMLGRESDIEKLDAVPFGIFSQPEVTGSSLTRTNSALWSGGKVPYVLDDSLSTSQKNFLKQTIIRFNELMAVHNIHIKFVQRNESETKHVQFEYLPPGWSCGKAGIGSPSSKRPQIISSHCFDQKTVYHEIPYSLGIQHEIQRPDRDEYVEILIQPGDPFWGSYFKIGYEAPHNAVTNGGYDFKSIMHYVLDENFRLRPKYAGVTLGGETLSKLDLAGLKKMYNMPGAGFNCSRAMIGQIPEAPKNATSKIISYNPKAASIEWLQDKNNTIVSYYEYSCEEVDSGVKEAFNSQIFSRSSFGVHSVKLENSSNGSSLIVCEIIAFSDFDIPSVPVRVIVNFLTRPPPSVDTSEDSSYVSSQQYAAISNGQVLVRVSETLACKPEIITGVVIDPGKFSELKNDYNSTLCINSSESDKGSQQTGESTLPLRQGKYIFSNIRYYIYNNGKNCRCPFDESGGTPISSTQYEMYIVGKTEKYCR